MQKFLVIQTAFTGDVVLASGLIEKLHHHFPNAAIDFLVRKGNETLFDQHPYLRRVLIWNKQAGKYKSLFQILKQVRAEQYDTVINIQRYASTGWLTAFSGARQTIGFNKNPWSILFKRSVKHQMSSNGPSMHEIERNHLLIRDFTDDQPAKPVLYPSAGDMASVLHLQQKPYICIAPSSVWFTKQLPAAQWISLIDQLPPKLNIYLLGAPGDAELCAGIRTTALHPFVENLAGKLSFLQSAALMKGAVMNYVNDSAPMHFASAVNAPVAAVYCSTVPAFGYGPLSETRFIIETSEQLPCRPCGLHGHKACPRKHFACAVSITTEQLLAPLSGRI